jgi:hypothetical protein
VQAKVRKNRLAILCEGDAVYLWRGVVGERGGFFGAIVGEDNRCILDRPFWRPMREEHMHLLPTTQLAVVL